MCVVNLSISHYLVFTNESKTKTKLCTEVDELRLQVDSIQTVIHRAWLQRVLYMILMLGLWYQSIGEVFDIYACFPCFIHKGGEVFMFMNICFILQIGEKVFDEFYAWLACLSPCICIHVYEPSLHIFIVYCYAWVKGELLWSIILFHAYITPWVLSSSKRGRLLAQRPSTLVLMMINSCSYVY